MVPRDLHRPRALARGGRRDREVRERPRRHRDRQRRRRHREHRGLRPWRRHRDHDPAGRGRAAPVALRLHRRRLPLRAVRRQSRDGQPGRAALARPEDRVGRRPSRVAHGARRGPQGRLLHVARPEGLDVPLGFRARRPRHPRVPRPVPDVARRRPGEDHLGARGRRERQRARHDHRHRLLDRRVGRRVLHRRRRRAVMARPRRRLLRDRHVGRPPPARVGATRLAVRDRLAQQLGVRRRPAHRRLARRRRLGRARARAPHGRRPADARLHPGRRARRARGRGRDDRGRSG